VVTAFEPRDWHVREKLFGYIVAVVAGFLLTGGAELDRKAAPAG